MVNLTQDNTGSTSNTKTQPNAATNTSRYITDPLVEQSIKNLNQHTYHDIGTTAALTNQTLQTSTLHFHIRIIMTTYDASLPSSHTDTLSNCLINAASHLPPLMYYYLPYTLLNLFLLTLKEVSFLHTSLHSSFSVFHNSFVLIHTIYTSILHSITINSIPFILLYLSIKKFL